MRQESRSGLACLALGVVLALAGCGGAQQSKEAEGSAQAVVTLPQALSASDVVRVELTVSGAGMTTRTDALVKTGGQWGGVLGQLPAGTGRTFSAQAFDASNTVRYAGQVTPVTIQAGQTTAVTLLLQELNAPAPFENVAPRILSLVASPGTVAPGGQVALQATAEDPNAGDTLTYAWAASTGSFGAASSLSTAWTAPASAGPVVLTLTVTDSKGASAALSVTITVSTGNGSAAVNVDFNTWPQVAGVTALPSSVAVGQSTQVTASANDSDGDNLSYQWTADCAGTWTNATSASASFTPSAQPSGGTCALTVTVHDGRGGQGTGSLSIYVGPPTTARFPPEVVETFQSVTSVPPAGGTVVFRVRASDPQSSALSYSWTASVGTLGVPSNGPTQSAVMWTPPACVVSGNTASITATVTNAFNLTTVTGFTVSGLSLCGGWAATGAMTSPRSFHTATLLKNGTVLVAGGRSAASGSFLSTAEVYDPVSGTWSATGPMASIRELHSATLLPSGKVLVAGGYTGLGRTATAEVYDPASGTWSATGPMASIRSNHTATLLTSGKVLVAGGYGSSSNNIATAELYDPASGTWSATGSMTSPRRDHKAALLPDGRVIVTGGWNGSGGIHATAELYHPASGGGWGSAGVMALPRVAHTMTLLNDGKVLVAGGYGNGRHHATAEVYGPWREAGSMARTSVSHTATLLKNGKVLVAGGEGGASSSVATARVYDPASDTWSETGSMASPRRGHTETLIPNGKVLISGGLNSEGYLAAAELYTP
ncbi:kelch-like protein [Corallococcus sp. AB011P]|uniref:Kelch repeat-containing protein n=1 Tax=Corallococcus sp. AB011P TaxID=2316735 RepID=UPI000EA1C57E|nr:kelch repeat-containing protein [Corallococcus sp. AB011P]RKG48679.1 kelch-like protein [Corallococcus sp. AB011P]